MAKEDHEDLKSIMSMTLNISTPLTAAEAKKIADSVYEFNPILFEDSMKYAYEMIRKAAKQSNCVVHLENENSVWRYGNNKQENAKTFEAAAQELIDKGYKVGYDSRRLHTRVSWE